jgi:cell division protease FtsH
VLLAAVVLALALWAASDGGGEGRTLSLGELEARAASGQVASATVRDRDQEVHGRLTDGTSFTATFPEGYAGELTSRLLAAHVELTTAAQRPSAWTGLLYTLLPTVLILGVLLFVLSRTPGGRSAMQLGRAKAKRFRPEGPVVTFADVAGIDEAVEELAELKDFLAHPERFAAVGARVPRGVLLYGPPGTGKTLLARAVAGEAGVPFFSISGSDFVEMFVGVGASRVRDLFAQAKAEAPAIVFVDEIDAVGRHRGQGLAGANDEREQTLNQLLVEMDGFEQGSGVIVIAGTNRPDILDAALLRPGRFDRQVAIDRPDVNGRRAILEVHAKDKPLEPAVDLGVIARRTPGFTGADLANVLNEAAITTARRGAERVLQADLEAAVEKVIAGPEKRTRVMTAHEKRVVAYHEAGHALVGHLLPGCSPVHKVSIMHRGRALGWTLALPEEERLMQSRSELRDELAMLLGGRAAEELVTGDPTTGAQNDIERATRIARAMVTQFGMSDAIGPRQVGELDGRDPLAGRDASEVVLGAVDTEVQALLVEARGRARQLLDERRDALDRLAAALVERETLTEDDLADLLPPRPPPTAR